MNNENSGSGKYKRYDENFKRAEMWLAGEPLRRQDLPGTGHQHPEPQDLEEAAGGVADGLSGNCTVWRSSATF